MRHRFTIFFLCIFLALAAGATMAFDPAGPSAAEENASVGDGAYSRLYRIEAQGVAIGYSLESCEPTSDPKVRLYKTRTLLRTGSGKAGASTQALLLAEYEVDIASGLTLNAHIAQFQGRVYEIREAVFQEGQVEIRITRHKGEDTIETLTLPKDVVVPYTTAMPALKVMESDADSGQLLILNLAEGRVDTVTVRSRGEASLNDGKDSPKCRRYQLDPGDVYRETVLWLDENGVLMKKEMPVQGMVFKRASDKVAARFEPDIEALSPFIPVKTKIENRAALTYCLLRVKLYCPEVKDAASLDHANQRFAGRVKNDFIEGVFKVRASYLDRTGSESFPAKVAETMGLAEHLKPAPAIESDDPEIAQAAKGLSQNLRKRWHAAHSLGVGVRNRVTYDPAGETSALAALRAKRADALGLTRLHVALCRSLGIPARVTRGAIYSLADESAGFVEHVWSEVYLGAQGWVPMDVTAGALTFLDAGHLRLGAEARFRPVEVEILDFIPKPEAERGEAPRKTAGFPISRGETHIYDYFINNEPWGTEKITLSSTEQVDGKTRFTFTSTLDLNTMKGSSTTRATSDGRLVSYDANLGEVSCSCRVEGDEILCLLRQGDSEQEKKVPLPCEGFFFDTHQIFQRGYMLSRLDIEPGEVIQISVFQPASMRVLSLQVERGSDLFREINGKRRRVQVFELMGGGQRMRSLLSPEGLLLEEVEKGGLSRIVWRGKE